MFIKNYKIQKNTYTKRKKQKKFFSETIAELRKVRSLVSIHIVKKYI